MAATEEFTEDEVQPLSTTIVINEEEKSKSLSEPIQIIPSKVRETETQTHLKEETKPIDIQTSTSTDYDNDENKPLQHNVIIDIECKNKNSMDRLDPNDIGNMNLIDRAHSDPLAIQSKQSNKIGENVNNNNDNNNNNNNSDPFASSKKYHSHDDILDSNKLGDFKGFNIREFSVEVIGIKYDNGRQEKKEEIIVPSRDNLVKIPFYSTPLTLESTNNAFFDFRERLNEMGFISQAEAALIHTRCESVENAVAFILNNMDAIYHRFNTGENINNNNNNNINKQKSLESINEMNSIDENININHENKALKICKLCNESFDLHLIDEKGNKIEIGINENNYNYNDNDDNTLLNNELILEQESVKSIELNSEKINEIICKTISELEPSPIYKGETLKCLICFEDKPIDFYIAQTECGHNKYCKQCLTQHYKIKTKDGDVLKVKCIDPSCEREIKQDEILNFLTDNEIKEKFHKFKRQKLLMLNENARFCPKIDCEGYMIGSRIKPKLQCPECSTIICFNCSKLWHGYFTKCSSAESAFNTNENESDTKYYQWELNKDVKKCPKCRMRIEKNEGCNHMTCVSCKYEFCWVCKGKYNSNHFSQWNIFGCPGAQYNNRGSICSIQRCPKCMPMWLRRLLIIIAVILLLPIIIVFGILAGCFYGCAICVVFIFENACSCC